MGRVVDFVAINTKIKTMEGVFLTKDQYVQLIECDNFREALRYLRDRTRYGKVLKGYDVEELHRGQLEVILKRQYTKNFIKLSYYLRDDYKKLLRIVFTRFEVEDIKVVLRGKFIGKRNEELNKLLTSQSSMSTVDYEQLLLARNVSEVVEKLKGTVYYKHIYNLAEDVEKEGLFRMEMALDFVYFIMLRRFLKRLPKEDREIIKKMNGVYADLLNIQWIFRGIKYYKLTPEILFNYTIYDGLKLKKEDVKRLCYSKNLDEFYKKVSSTTYRVIFDKSSFQEYLLEKEILVYLKKLYMKYKTEAKMNISVVLSYLELSLLECRDIITIVENQRYSQQSEEIMKYVTVTI